MFNPRDLSKFFTTLPQRWQTMQTDIADIERERLLIDDSKVVPVSVFLRTFALHESKPTLMQRQAAKAAPAAVELIFDWIKDEAVPLMTSNVAGMSDVMLKLVGYVPDAQKYIDSVESDDMGMFFSLDTMSMHISMPEEDGSRRAVVPFMQLGHMIEAVDRHMLQDDFQQVTHIDAFWGRGRANLAVWKSLNALYDFSRQFNDPEYKPPRPKRKPRLQAAKAPAWIGAAQPSF